MHFKSINIFTFMEEGAPKLGNTLEDRGFQIWLNVGGITFVAGMKPKIIHFPPPGSVMISEWSFW